MAIPNVNIGPLDPDKTAEFGSINGSKSARDLLRRHKRILPEALLKALRLRINGPRSKALVRSEVVAAATGYFEQFEHGVPDGFRVVGASVHGEEDGEKKWVGYTFRVASGRTGKGAVAYTLEAFPQSIAAGDVQARIAAAKEAGQIPIISTTGSADQAPAGLSEAQVDAKVRAAVDAATTELGAKLDNIADMVRGAAAVAPPAGGDDGEQESDGGGEAGSDPEAGAGDGGDDDAPPEPWEGFAEQNVTDVRERMKTATPDEAQAAITYEQSAAGRHRATVVTAANAVIDRSSGK